jgi:adenylyltransferase/sulfurtransferase
MEDRYSRQIIVPGIGEEGQAHLAASSIVVIGCGALGTIIASSLVRAGVGRVRIVDRDFIEYHNLQRQILFDEEDIRNELPKAVAAERRLRKINSTIEIEGIVADANHTNIEGFVEGTDLILDGLDNFEARFLINDVSLKHGIPWVYGAAIGASGMTASFIPGRTPCFRCLSASAPMAGTVGTCDTAGVLGPAPFIVGSLQAAAALRLLLGAAEADPALTLIDVWSGTFNRLRMGHREDCPACAGRYEFLDGKVGLETTSLCGQNVVQVLNTGGVDISLPEMAARLEPVADNVSHNEHMLRFGVGEDREMIVFPDGRALVRNTTDESLARALYARYIGA